MARTESSSEHLNAGELEALRGDEGTPDQVAHLGSCGICQASYDELSELAAELAPLAACKVQLPAELDEQILWSARKRALAARRRPSRRPIQIAAGALAASLVLFITSTLLQLGGGPSSPTNSQIASADVDGDGQINIRDAFVVARALAAGAEIQSNWDLSGDGTVDNSDVDLIAARAVALRRS